MLERYGHGGDLETAAAIFGRPADSFIDFSSNMNPWGPPESARSAMLRAWERIAAYPDPAARRLRALLAERHQVPPEAVWVGNGAAEAIDLSLRSARPKATVVAAPGFAEYETAAKHADSRIVRMTAEPDNQFRIQAEAVIQAAAQADAIVLGHPNNPTGQPLEPATIEAALTHYRTVVIDEAFLDFSPDEHRLTLTRQAAERPGLFVIRSMTKFYAIPGLRLGYVIAHPDEIARIREQAIPWSANSIALEAGAAVLQDDEYAERTLRWLTEERAHFSASLQKLGLQVFPGIANFLLVRFRTSCASAVQEALGRRGVLIRNAATFSGLEDGTYMRLAVKRREENERLLAEIQSWLEEAAAG